MSLLEVERIKLFSTRSPWWCAAVIIAIMAAFAAMMAGLADGEIPTTIATTQFGYAFGLAVVAVLATLSVTNEYRFGTIRTTFLAVPHRTSALVSKTAVVAVLALVIGEIASFVSLGIAALINPDADLALNTTAEWLNVTGVGVIFAFTAVMAVAIGIMLRHTAGAISLLLVYIFVVESLLPLIPKIGDDLLKWSPFHVADKFLSGSGGSGAGAEMASTSTLSQGGALAYFAGIAIALLVVALVSANRRDA